MYGARNLLEALGVWMVLVTYTSPYGDLAGLFPDLSSDAGISTTDDIQQ